MAKGRGWIRLLQILPAVAAFGLLGLMGYTLLDREEAQVAGRDPDALPSPLLAKPAPEFDLKGLREGEKNFTTADLHGPGVKVVNIWASWCGPCRIEHPELEKLAARGVPIYGINYKDDPEKALHFLDALGDPFEQIGADTRGRAAIDWGVYGVPETFVIDGQGRIAYKHVGPIQNDDLDRVIMPAIEAAKESPKESPEKG